MTSHVPIAITSPGFTPPTRTELVRYRGDKTRQDTEGLVKAIWQKIRGLSYTEVRETNAIPLFDLVFCPKTEVEILRAAVDRYSNVGWRTEIESVAETNAPRLVFFSGGEQTQQPLELDFGWYPPGPFQLLDLYRCQSPWRRSEGLIMALWQRLARDTHERSSVQVARQLGVKRHARPSPDPDEVVRIVLARFSARGWNATFDGNAVHVS